MIARLILIAASLCSLVAWPLVARADELVEDNNSPYVQVTGPWVATSLTQVAHADQSLPSAVPALGSGPGVITGQGLLVGAIVLVVWAVFQFGIVKFH